MLAGKLNRRVSIQTQATTQDVYGQEQQVWTTIYTCWASISIQNSQLLYETAEFMSKTVVRIEMRWTSSVVIEANMRVIYTEPTTGVVHTYNIETPINTAQGNRELVILAYELKIQE
jgi:SPP1 family predicted phage head-tail adaptor